MNLIDDFLADAVEPGYSAELLAGVTYQITFEWERIDGSVPPLLYTYSEAGRLEFATLTSDNTQQLVFSPSDDATYYFVAEYPDNGSEHGSLADQLIIETIDDNYADNANTKGVITPLAAVDASLEVADDADWFRADLQAGVTYQFIAQSDEALLQLTAISTEESELGEGAEEARQEFGSSDFSSGSNFLTLTPQADSTFYIEVDSLSIEGNSADYSLMLSAIEDDFADHVNTGAQLTLDAHLTGAINSQDDADLVHMELDAGYTYQITVEMEDPMVPAPFLEWFSLDDEQGLQFPTSDGLSDLTISPVLGGSYFLRIEDSVGTEDFSAYRYTLNLESAEAQPELPENAPDDFMIVEKIALLYEAALDREPDEAGLNYFIGDVRQGQSLQQIANSFYLAEEFRDRFDSFSDAAYIEHLYHNVLEREPDQEGFDYWEEQLQSGLSHADILVSFAESAENRENSAEWVDDLVYEADTDMWLI